MTVTSPAHSAVAHTLPAVALAAVPRFTAWVALGGNLGDVPATFAQALSAMHALPGTCVRAVSALYHTAPWQAQGPLFCNAVAALETALGAEELLHALLRTEAALGRERPYPNAPRTLDLDLLALGDRRSATPFLTLPHPRAHERAFVLAPWADAVAQLRSVSPGHVLTHTPCLPPAVEVAALCQAQGARAASPHQGPWLTPDPATSPAGTVFRAHEVN